MLIVKHEAIIHVGEDAFQAFLEGQITEGHRNLFLEKRFISLEPDSRLLLDVSGHVQKRSVFEVYGEQAVFDSHRVGAKSIRRNQEDGKKGTGNKGGPRGCFKHFQIHYFPPCKPQIAYGLSRLSAKAVIEFIWYNNTIPESHHYNLHGFPLL
jgi:hypothetical protein